MEAQSSWCRWAMGREQLRRKERIRWSPGHPRDGDSCWPSISSWQLLPQIERQLFEETVKTLNGFYAEAEKIGGSSYLEGCLACATAYFIFLCMETHYEKVLMPWGGQRKWEGWGGAGTRAGGCSVPPLHSQVLKKISKYIQEQNEKVYAPRGLLLTDPLERGMRVVSSGIRGDEGEGWGDTSSEAMADASHG